MSLSASYDVDLAKEYGIPAAALYNKLIYLSRYTTREDGYCWRTAEQLTNELGISAKAQKNAADKLVEAKLILAKNTYIKGTTIKCKHFYVLDRVAVLGVKSDPDKPSESEGDSTGDTHSSHTDKPSSDSNVASEIDNTAESIDSSLGDKSIPKNPIENNHLPFEIDDEPDLHQVVKMVLLRIKPSANDSEAEAFYELLRSKSVTSSNEDDNVLTCRMRSNLKQAYQRFMKSSSSKPIKDKVAFLGTILENNIINGSYTSAFRTNPRRSGSQAGIRIVPTVSAAASKSEPREEYYDELLNIDM